MDQLTALKELAEKVKAGDAPTQFADFSKASSPSFGELVVYFHAFQAYNSSLDAAHSLHGVVLGEGWLCFTEYHLDGLPSIVKMQSKKTGKFVEVQNTRNPARAWLLAIIKAKIAELEEPT